QVMMTSSTHASGTDRLAEVVERMQLGEGRIVVNVQGDEPLIPPQVVDQVASNLAENEWSSVATLCEPIRDTEPLLDPAAVKVVFDKRGQACYFSRSCIPWPRNHQWSSGEMPPGCWYRHIGIYAYRAGFLTRFSRWQEAPTEHIESLEQLRALHQGERIHVAEASVPVPGGVDTEADLQSVRDQIKEQDS
ncbi:MAG: 3-deoxy-manno-octulosonate cytidylyltransferase, partial [Pseudomonadota bacterium]